MGDDEKPRFDCGKRDVSRPIGIKARFAGQDNGEEMPPDGKSPKTPHTIMPVASERSFSDYLRSHFGRGDFISLYKIVKNRPKFSPFQKSGPDINWIPDDDNSSSLVAPQKKMLSASDSMIQLCGRNQRTYERIIRPHDSSSSSSSSTSSTSSSSDLKTDDDSRESTETKTDNDDSCSSSSSSPFFEDQLSPPEPPDGGWGWVVVIAAFFVQMITDGVPVSFGIFLDDLAEEFDASLSVTSWVGAFSFGIPALAAPLASMFINKFACRKVCIAGGLISAMACALSFFVNSMFGLVITFGVLCGFGSSLSSTAALIIVSVYFDDRRATATGLSIAGCGVGSFVFAPLVSVLINLYTWRGAMLILAGVFANIIVFGCLMRPVETGKERRKRQLLLRMENFAKESGFKLPQVYRQTEDEAVEYRIQLLRRLLTSPVTNCYDMNSAASSPIMLSARTSKENAFILQKVPCEHKHVEQSGDHTSAVPVGAKHPIEDSLLMKTHSTFQECETEHQVEQKPAPLISSTAANIRHALASISPVYSRTKRSIFHRTTTFQASTENQLRSVLSMPELPASPSSLSSSSSSSSTRNCYKKATHGLRKQIRHHVYGVIDPSMLENFQFNLFLVSTMLLFFWCNVTYFFMAVYATEVHGISNKLAAMLFAVMGGSGTVGEVAFGWAADQEWCNTLYLYCGGVLFCGIATMLVPLAKNFASMVCYSCEYIFPISLISPSLFLC